MLQSTVFIGLFKCLYKACVTKFKRIPDDLSFCAESMKLHLRKNVDFFSSFLTFILALHQQGMVVSNCMVRHKAYEPFCEFCENTREA